jgi:hypothetical protein
MLRSFHIARIGFARHRTTDNVQHTNTIDVPKQRNLSYEPGRSTLPLSKRRTTDVAPLRLTFMRLHSDNRLLSSCRFSRSDIGMLQRVQRTIRVGRRFATLDLSLWLSLLISSGTSSNARPDDGIDLVKVRHVHQVRLRTRSIHPEFERHQIHRILYIQVDWIERSSRKRLGRNGRRRNRIRRV